MLRRGDGGAAHFGGDVVALEKDEVFKRERVHGEYSTRSLPARLFPENAFEGCTSGAGGNNLQA